jgi:hypothetical protein
MRTCFAFLLLAAVACASKGATPPAATPEEKPEQKVGCDGCTQRVVRGEPKCAEAYDGPCHNERVGSCMHFAICEARCCAAR